MTVIAVTGSHGFIGGALVSALELGGISVRRIDRALLEEAARTDLSKQIEGCAAIVHCAGLTPRRGRGVPDDQFDLANHRYTKNVGAASRDAGVARLVFVSSIAAVAGHKGKLSPEMPQNPLTAYGRSKAKAETAILGIDGLQSIVVRPPLVYGPETKGDLNLLVRLCASPLPLPFGAVHNRRSMVGVTNLVDALRFLATAGSIESTSQILHVSDGIDLSLRDLVVAIRAGLGRPPGLVNASPRLLEGILSLTGQRGLAQKLLGDLEIDVSRLLGLGWRPPVTPEFDLKRMARAPLGNLPG